MSTYDSYETVEVPRKHKHHHHHHSSDRDRDRDRERDRDYDEPRFVETRETYIRGSAPLEADIPYASRETDLIRRPGREDSELSVEEVRREFPPPGAAGFVSSRSMVREDRYGPPARSRSLERGSQYGQYLVDPRDERRGHRKVVKEEEIIEPRRRSLSRNQKILAGVAGAALAVGGKELYDRRKNHGAAPEDRNLLATAAIGAVGAFAGYEGAEQVAKRVGKDKKVKKETYIAYQGRNGDAAEYYSSDTEHEKEKSKKSRRKSIVEGALGLAGLGAAAKSLTGGGDDKGDRRSRRGSDSGESRTSKRRDKSRGGEHTEGIAKFQQAAKAALLAGATEAFRVRNEPGGWAGAKGKRILTAAIGAGGIDAAADRDPEHHSKRHILEAVVGGLAGNRLINGSRSELETGGGKGGSSRSRSRAPSSSGLGGGAGLAALATAGLGALAGKKLLDRSKSRDRAGDDDDRDDRRSNRRRDVDSDDDYDDKPRRRRSKSVTDFARKGLAAFGIGEAASEAGHGRDRDRDVVEETRVTKKTSRRHRDRSDDDDDDDHDDRRSDRRRSKREVATRDDRYDDSRDGESTRSRQKSGKDAKRVAEGKQELSDSDSLGSSSGDEKRVRKMKGKQFLTAGLATVATIHAAHNVYQSYEKREARRKAVASGEMSKEEAQKLRKKAVLQDAASIGIAALGIKGAVSEWQEMREMRHEYKEFEEKKEERHQKRVERQKQLKNGDQDGGKALSRRRTAPAYASAPDLSYGGRYDQSAAPYYVDGNPYASGGLPAPPVGYAYEPRR